MADVEMIDKEIIISCYIMVLKLDVPFLYLKINKGDNL
jgi:hypothetical protein